MKPYVWDEKLAFLLEPIMPVELKDNKTFQQFIVKSINNFFDGCPESLKETEKVREGSILVVCISSIMFWNSNVNPIPSVFPPTSPAGKA